MSKKDLTPYSLIDVEPQLYTLYANAHKKVFNKPVHLPKKSWSLFSVFEDDLRNAGYDSKDYAYTIVKSLQKWAADKHLTFIPPAVFCGRWAFDRYVKIHDSKSVKIQTVEEDSFATLLYSELLAARSYIADRLSGKDVRFSQSVTSIQPMLDKDWLQMYHKQPVCEIRRRLIHESLTTLCREYGIQRARSYSDLVTLIQ
jgi:hypothetical protein